MIAVQGVVHERGQGEVLEARVNHIMIKASAEDTGGAYALVEYTILAQSPGPGLHRHAQFDEAFYLLDGALTIQIDGRTIEATTGSFVLIPRGAVHSYANPHAVPATFLLLASPGGFEGYFREMAALLASGGQPDPETVLTLQAAYDTLPVRETP